MPEGTGVIAGLADPGAAGAALLSWYDANARRLPWRVPPAESRNGARPDPYRVWLSEVMLQQTTVEAVKPYFARFTALWPDVASLAAAEPDDVMRAWAGLGYYSRARNLVACARRVAEKHEGRFPQTEAELRKLPGIGAYTAAAIASIAFGERASVVDGNVERVVSRLAALPLPPAQTKGAVRDFVFAMTPEARPGDFAQGMMDLGATVCTPRRPACILCPFRAVCLARLRGTPELFPVKAPRKPKPLRLGAAFAAVRRDGAVLLVKRAASGLLGGMAGLPTSAWSARADGDATAATAPFPAVWRKAGEVEHGFTHFTLRLSVFRADGVETAKAPPGHWWSRAADIEAEALPTVMRKALRCAMPAVVPPSSKEKP